MSRAERARKGLVGKKIIEVGNIIIIADILLYFLIILEKRLHHVAPTPTPTNLPYVLDLKNPNLSISILSADHTQPTPFNYLVNPKNASSLIPPKKRIFVPFRSPFISPMTDATFTTIIHRPCARQSDNLDRPIFLLAGLTQRREAGGAFFACGRVGEDPSRPGVDGGFARLVPGLLEEGDECCAARAAQFFTGRLVGFVNGAAVARIGFGLHLRGGGGDILANGLRCRSRRQRAAAGTRLP